MILKSCNYCFYCCSSMVGEKELKPISGRVKDIAEFVLTCIMEQVVSTAFAKSSNLHREYSPGAVACTCNQSYFWGRVRWMA